MDNLADCYRLLGLKSGATPAEIKASYRRLARLYHPDVNPDDSLASEKFIQVTEAYNILLSAANTKEGDPPLPPLKKGGESEKNDAREHQPSATKVTRKQTEKENNPELSKTEEELKWGSYKRLQQLLKSRRFVGAIALVEGLAQRFPHDIEVRQWQAIAYSSWGNELVNQKQINKARLYLKKALRTDPNNRALWTEVERQFRRIEQILC